MKVVIQNYTGEITIGSDGQYVTFHNRHMLVCYAIRKRLGVKSWSEFMEKSHFQARYMVYSDHHEFPEFESLDDLMRFIDYVNKVFYPFIDLVHY